MSYRLPQRHRPDGNQSELVKRFVALGGVWIPYANKPFDGWAWHPRWAIHPSWGPQPRCGYMPVEIKLSERDGHANEYTPRQRKVMQTMQVAGCTWLTWRTVEDVDRCVGARRAA